MVNEFEITGIVIGVFDVFGQILVLPMESAIGFPGITLRVASDEIAGDPQFAVTIHRNLFECKDVVAVLTRRVLEFDPLNNALLLILM
ncbi:MAG: hypothetical protein ACKO55_07225 [Bacteroidota bacterium]